MDDADGGLDPETPLPTPSEVKLAAEFEEWREQLDDAEARAEREIDRGIELIAREEQAYEQGGQASPEGGWRRFPWEFIPVFLLGMVEIFALEGPVATLLAIEQGSFENYSITAMMAMAAAAFGTMFGHARARSDFSVGGKVPRIERNSSRRQSWLWAGGVIVVAVFAVVARVYAQTLLGGTIDPEGLAGFVLFQLTFATFALGLGLLHGKRMVAERIAVTEDHIRGRRDTKVQLTQRRETMAGDRVTRERRFAAIGEKALSTYRDDFTKELAKDDQPAAAIWRTRFNQDRMRLGQVPPPPRPPRPQPEPPTDGGTGPDDGPGEDPTRPTGPRGGGPDTDTQTDQADPADRTGTDGQASAGTDPADRPSTDQQTSAGKDPTAPVGADLNGHDAEDDGDLFRAIFGS